MRRNIERFPDDFMFELTREEFDRLRPQFATSNRGGTRYMPMAFTEHGVNTGTNETTKTWGPTKQCLPPGYAKQCLPPGYTKGFK
ncbi:ORF6N domain-containing protein [Desulfoplanes sp. PS50]